MLSSISMRALVASSACRCRIGPPNFASSRQFSSTMDLIKQLRSQSGAPMMECKKALQESSNDLNKAIDWLRQHGVAKASSKTSGRSATEGLIGLGVSSDAKSASLVKISSETDFASRSPPFVELVTHVTQATLEMEDCPSSSSNNQVVVDEATLLQTQHDNKTVQQVLDDAILAIRENISLTSVQRYTCQEGQYVGYVHGRMEGSQNVGTSAALVHLQPTTDNDSNNDSEEAIQEIGKKLAMHVVAAKPLYKTPDSVPPEIVEKEESILEQQLADTNKPPEIIEKIVNGRMQKYYQTVCLTEQPHMVEEGNPKVAKVLKEANLQVTDFHIQSVP